MDRTFSNLRLQPKTWNNCVTGSHTQVLSVCGWILPFHLRKRAYNKLSKKVASVMGFHWAALLQYKGFFGKKRCVTSTDRQDRYGIKYRCIARWLKTVEQDIAAVRAASKKRSAQSYENCYLILDSATSVRHLWIQV
jgi:hypothetical protein